MRPNVGLLIKCNFLSCAYFFGNFFFWVYISKKIFFHFSCLKINHYLSAEFSRSLIFKRFDSNSHYLHFMVDRIAAYGGQLALYG